MSPARYVKGPSGFVELGGGGGLSFPQRVSRTAVGGVAVTASATPHTKGSWTELIASTTSDTTWLYVKAVLPTGNAVDTSFLMDIGTGAAASEVVRIANIGCGYHTDRGNGFIFPISIPAGSRVAARGQATVASRVATVHVSVLSDAATATLPTTLDTIGAVTASSRGTNMPTSNTYVQMTASTSQAYQALVACFTGAAATLDLEATTYTIASGAGGSEVALMDFTVQSETTERLLLDPGNYSTLYVGNIPAGTRLAARQSVGRNNRDVILYGVPYA